MNARLYIGCNNKTGRLELDKIKRITSARHQGFTLWRATGYWQGKAEPTAVLTVADNAKKIHQLIAHLKIELEQDAIAYEVAPEMRFQ
jgi:hypothetical protein